MKNFLLLFLLFPHFVFASWSTNTYNYSATCYAGTCPAFTSPILAPNSLAVCAAWGATYYNLHCYWGNDNTATTNLVKSSSVVCPANATLTVSTGTCTCNSGYSQSSASPPTCTSRASSPNGATAPVGPLGGNPIFIAGAVALGMLGAAAALAGVPLLGVLLLANSAVASGMLSSPPWFGGSGSANTASQQFVSSGSPLSVNLAPSDAYTSGAAGSSGAVGVNSGGAFVPSGGGTYSGTGATGGWTSTTGGATGEWTYYQTVPGGSAVPIASIADSGYTYKAVTDVTGGLSSGSVVAKTYADGSTTVTDARTVPVITSGGSVTTAKVGVVNSFGPDGARLPGGSAATIGPTLGDGTASNGGSGLAIIGAGSGGGGGGTGAGTGGPVRIDESLMPATPPSDFYKLLADRWQVEANQNLGTISGSGDKGFFSGWDLFFSAPAVVACTPYQLPRGMGSIDPCPVVDGVRVVMGYLWAIGALYLCIGMVRKTV